MRLSSVKKSLDAVFANTSEVIANAKSSGDHQFIPLTQSKEQQQQQADLQQHSQSERFGLEATPPEIKEQFFKRPSKSIRLLIPRINIQVTKAYSYNCSIQDYYIFFIKINLSNKFF